MLAMVSTSIIKLQKSVLIKNQGALIIFKFQLSLINLGPGNSLAMLPG